MADELLMWIVGLVGTLLSVGVFHVLNGINSTLKDIRIEVHSVGTNLTRLDRRVAYLEGRYDGGRERGAVKKESTECPTV